MRGRSFLEGAGIAILALATELWPMLKPHNDLIYHSLKSAFVEAAGLTIDLIIVAFAWLVLMLALERSSRKKKRVAWAFIAAFVGLGTVNLALMLLRVLQVHWGLLASIRVPTYLLLLVFCGVLAVSLTASISSPERFGTGIRWMRVGVAIFGCCVVWMLPELVSIVILAHRNEPRQDAFHRSVPPHSASHGRVIWVLFDELSYDQVYQDRQPGLELPQFDRLKNESIVFSNVKPEGYQTERVLPALFLHRRIDRVRSSLGGKLSVHETGASHWEPFSAQDTIFASAKRLGWTTGVGGWYNPYCQMLRTVLDTCYWQYRPSVPITVLGNPLLTAVVTPFYMLFSRAGMFTSQHKLDAGLHTKDFRDLMAASRALIRDEAIDFVFLHLPIPHPPAIYDRRTGQFKPGGSYLDNLALADMTLGEILNEIQETEAARSTTLIVSSDHSWRIPLWQSDEWNPEWTPEDKRASGGRFDDRPFLAIRFPKESHGEVWSGKFPELETDDVLAALLSGQVQSRAELDDWLQQSAREQASSNR